MAKNRIDDIKAILADCSYEELKETGKIASLMMTDMLSGMIKIGSPVTVEGKGDTDKELTIYGITADYYILKEEDTVLKKQFTLDDFLSVEGIEI